MKIFKTMTAAVLLLMGTVVMAQGQGNRQMRSATERAKMETERMVKALELAADQTVKVQEVNLKYAIKDSARFADMRKEQANGQVDRETRMKEMKESREAKTTEMKAYLTDDQKVKYDAYLKERDQRGPRGGGQGGQGNNSEGGSQGGQQ